MGNLRQQAPPRGTTQERGYSMGGGLESGRVEAAMCSEAVFVAELGSECRILGCPLRGADRSSPSQ